MEWLPLTDEQIRESVLRTVKAGAQRLADPEQVRMEMLALMQARQEAGKEFVPWSAPDLARGYGGFCVLFGAMDRAEPDGGWDLIGHRYLQAMQQVLMEEGVPGPALWSGLAGVILAARALSREGERYVNFVQELNAFFLQGFPNLMQFMEGKLEQGVALQEFDVMQGMSGIGRYLLCFADRQEMKVALERVLRYLVQLCADREWNGHVVPGWFTAPEQQHMASDRTAYPNGHFNCGLSHGIPGPLALLSLAARQGVEVAGQREAIQKIGSWLMRWREQDEFGPLWPARVSWEEYRDGRVQGVVPREAWCYGGPGVARALWLGGTVLENEEWKRTALAAYQGTARRPERDWNIESDTFCHGRAGLLQMVQRMYSESGDAAVGRLRDQLLVRMLERWNSDDPYGYHEAEHGEQQHLAGLLDGAAGVFTVLIGLIQEQDADWDAVFLIR